MKTMRLITSLNILLLFCICTGASADIILDTGATPGLAGYSLHSRQWLAAEFSIDEDIVITDVEGWLNGDFDSSCKIFTTAIYTIGPTGPGLEIYSAQISVNGSAQGWSGAIFLFGIGLAGLAGSRLRKQQRHELLTLSPFALKG